MTPSNPPTAREAMENVVRAELGKALAGPDLMPGDRAALQLGLDRLDRTVRLSLADDSVIVAALALTTDREVSVPAAIEGFATALNRTLDLLVSKGLIRFL